MNQNIYRSAGTRSVFDNGTPCLYKDRFTGLYHTQYREYDPLHERWLTIDPAGYNDGLNLYHAYMGVNGADPLGLWGIQFGNFNIGIGSPTLAFNRDSVKALGTGAKAVVNASADTVVSTLTLGMKDGVELLEVTDFDRSVNYDWAYGLGRGGTEALAAAGTMGLANVKAAGTTARVVNVAQKTLVAMDTAQGAGNIAKGSKDIVENGLTVQNVILVTTGALSLTPAISKLAAAKIKNIKANKNALTVQKSATARRAYLNQKFGRITGNLQKDITLRTYIKIAETLDVSTAKNTANFWSGRLGGISNFRRAKAFAR